MNAFLRERQHPMIIAHRGASADAPENTLAAFREAIRQKADAIELDVQQTLDKKLVIFHDPWVSRTTNGKGLLRNKTLREIKTLDAGSWFDPKFRGERVPTLDEVLKNFGETTNYVIELKFYRANPGRFARRVYDAVASRGLLERTLFLSFDPRLLMQIEKNNSAAKTCWAFIPILGWRPPGWLISRFDALAIASRQASPRYTDKLHALGKPVDLWAMVGKDEDYRAELKAHADFITTNHPAELRAEMLRSFPDN